MGVGRLAGAPGHRQPPGGELGLRLGFRGDRGPCRQPSAVCRRAQHRWPRALERGDVTLELIVITLIKTAIVVLGLLTGFAYLTLFERKVQARLQQRPGPNRVGPFGLLQPAADGLKLFFKSSSAPAGRDHFLYLLAPAISVIAALASFAIIPVSGPGDLNLFGHRIGWYVMNVNIGILWYLAVTSFGVYGIFLA
ncbi:MAG: hypothetical protein E6I70_16795, partial [Chloroflexi bacterium]